MRVLVTGSNGFVGRWVCDDLAANGHEPIASGGRGALDLVDRQAVARAVTETRPDAIIHLGGVSHSQAANGDPTRAVTVNIGGTINVLEAARRVTPAPVVLVAGSAEVYGWPDPSALPLDESSPLAPRGIYALTKAAQESVAVSYRARLGLRVIVCRSFNHSGPGQREPLALPSFARRVLDVAQGRAHTVTVGDIDVERDLLDVRDVATAYRLLLERLAEDGREAPAEVVNVASGRTVCLRALLDHLCALAGIDPAYSPEPELMRPGEPREIRGDVTRLHSMVDWRPARDVFTMVTDLWADLLDTTTVG